MFVVIPPVRALVGLVWVLHCVLYLVHLNINFIVANIKILGIMLISQLIKGSKEKIFIKPNFRRKYQTSSSGQKFFGKKCN